VKERCRRKRKPKKSNKIPIKRKGPPNEERITVLDPTGEESAKKEKGKGESFSKKSQRGPIPTKKRSPAQKKEKKGRDVNKRVERDVCWEERKNCRTTTSREKKKKMVVESETKKRRTRHPKLKSQEGGKPREVRSGKNRRPIFKEKDGRGKSARKKVR